MAGSNLEWDLTSQYAVRVVERLEYEAAEHRVLILPLEVLQDYNLVNNPLKVAHEGVNRLFILKVEPLQYGSVVATVVTVEHYLQVHRI